MRSRAILNKNLTFLTFYSCFLWMGGYAQNPSVSELSVGGFEEQSSCVTSSGADTTIHKLPLVFVKNQGQAENGLLYYSWFPQGIRIYKNLYCHWD